MLATAILVLALLTAVLGAVLDNSRETMGGKLRKVLMWALPVLVATGATFSYLDHLEANRRAIQLEDKLEGVRRYSPVARYTERGVTERARPSGLVLAGPMAGDLRGAYEEVRIQDKRWILPRCDHENIAKFENVAKKYPDFPFSHAALARCKSRKGNPEWRMHAERALEIFTHTTAITGHSPSHDRVKDLMERILTGPTANVAPASPSR